MDNIDDDYLTNLSWLKLPKTNERRSKVECTTNYIDDDLQCLCWLGKIRPPSSSSSLLKRLSMRTNKVNPYRNDHSTDVRVPSDNPLYPRQSFLFIRSSNGKISCLAIRHFV